MLPRLFVSITISAAAAALCHGQGGEAKISGTLSFSAETGPSQIQDYSKTIQAVAGLRLTRVGATEKAFLLEGTPGEIAVAEWLASGLEAPSSGAPARYTLPVAKDGRTSVRILYASSTTSLMLFNCQRHSSAHSNLQHAGHAFAYERLAAGDGGAGEFG